MRKGGLWKKTVSILLATAMVLTAVPVSASGFGEDEAPQAQGMMEEVPLGAEDVEEDTEGAEEDFQVEDTYEGEEDFQVEEEGFEAEEMPEGVAEFTSEIPESMEITGFSASDKELLKEGNITVTDSDLITYVPISEEVTMDVFYANGTTITIDAADDKQYNKITWVEDGESKTQLTTQGVTVFGGSSIEYCAATHVEMNGGTIRELYGGGYLKAVGSTQVNINGGVIWGSCYGGSANANADSTTVSMTNGKVSQIAGGGVYKDKSLSLDEAKNHTDNITDSATLLLKGGTIVNSSTLVPDAYKTNDSLGKGLSKQSYSLTFGGGGNGFTQTGESTLVIDGVSFAGTSYVSAGSTNGYLGFVSLQVVSLGSGSQPISVLQTINREINTGGADVHISGGSIKNLYLGGEDPETVDDDHVEGVYASGAKVDYEITEGVNVQEKAAVGWGLTSAELNVQSSEAINFKWYPKTITGKNGSEVVNNTLQEGAEWKFNGKETLKIMAADDNTTLTNSGTISGNIEIDSGVTFTNADTGVIVLDTDWENNNSNTNVLTNKGTFNNSGSVTANGKLINSASATIVNNADDNKAFLIGYSLINNGNFTNKGNLYIDGMAGVDNYGTISNEGYILNNAKTINRSNAVIENKEGASIHFDAMASLIREDASSCNDVSENANNPSAGIFFTVSYYSKTYSSTDVEGVYKRISNKELKEGTKIPRLEELTIPNGYRFDQWYSDSDEEVRKPWDFDTEIHDSTYIYADFIKKADNLIMDTENLTLIPKGTGELYVSVEPAAAKGEIQWKSSDTSVATVEAAKGNTNKATVTAGESAASGKTAKITATLDDKSASCTVTIKSMAAEVPKIDKDGDISNITDPIAGVEKGEDANQVKENLESLTTKIAEKGETGSGVVLSPVVKDEQKTAAEIIKEAAANNAKIVTVVNAEHQEENSVGNEDKNAIKTLAQEVLKTQEETLTVSYLNINITVKKVENNNTAIDIAKITELPKNQALPITVALPSSLQTKKVIVLSYHGNQAIQITDVVQKDGFVTFPAYLFSPYALVEAGDEFTVTFDTGSGYAVESQKVKYNTSATKPSPDPTWSSHTFRGWYEDAEYTTPWDFANNKITGDTTIYAKWSYNSPAVSYYNVSFDSRGGSAVPAINSVRAYSTIAKPADPTRENFVFGGWFKDAACTQAWEFAKDTVTGNLTLYAKWTEEEPETVLDPVVVKVDSRTTNTVKISWSESSKAEGYTVWARDEDQTGYKRVAIISKDDARTFTWKKREPGTKHFFVVKAWIKDENGKYVFSEASKTVRGTTKPETAKIKKVTVNAAGDLKVTLVGPAKGANRYAMCWSRKADFSRYAIGIRTQYTSQTMVKGLKPGTCYVKVRSYRQMGGSRVYGDWSEMVKVTF